MIWLQLFGILQHGSDYVCMSEHDMICQASQQLFFSLSHCLKWDSCVQEHMLLSWILKLESAVVCRYYQWMLEALLLSFCLSLIYVSYIVAGRMWMFSFILRALFDWYIDRNNNLAHLCLTELMWTCCKCVSFVTESAFLTQSAFSVRSWFLFCQCQEHLSLPPFPSCGFKTKPQVMPKCRTANEPDWHSRLRGREAQETL